MILHFREGHFWDAWDCEISNRSQFNPTSSEQIFGMNTGISQLYRTHSAATSIHSTISNNCDTNRDYLSHEQMTDMLSDGADDNLSNQRRFDRIINTVSNDRKMVYE